MPSTNYLDDDPSILPEDEERKRLLADTFGESNDGSSFSLPKPPALAPQNNSAPKFGLPSKAAPPGPAASTSPALDPSAYNAASQNVAKVTGQKPMAPQPKWWQRLAAGAVGGLAGFSNSQGKGDPIDPRGATDAIMGGPGYRRKLSDWQTQVEGTTAQQTAAADQLKAAEAIQKNNAEKEARDVQILAGKAKLAKLGQQPKTMLDAYNEAGQVPGTSEEERRAVAFGGKGLPHQPPAAHQNYEAYLVSQLNDPDPAKAAAARAELQGMKEKAAKDPSSQEQLLDSAALGAAVKTGIAGKLDQTKPVLPQLMKLNPQLATQVANDFRRDPASEQMKQLQMTATQLLISQRREQQAPPKEIAEGTPEYRVASDLASGRLTMQQFRSMYSYSRDVNKKLALYNKASEINPNFNPAQFEMGYAFAKTPKVQQQLASLDNVVRAVPDLLKFSDAATRSGVPVLNKLIVPGGLAVGGKKYSDFKTAQIAFADELSGALGYGSATDMSREMGFNMTNPNLSGEQFRSALENVVVPFIDRKRSTMLGQMGPYGQSGMNPAADMPKQAPQQSAAPQSQGDPMIKVQIPNMPPGQIHASQKERFLHDHPDAKVF